MVIRETERHDYPSYALEHVHSLARRGNVCYLFRSTRRDIENLGYGLDDICTCLMAIQENDFDHAESYSDMLDNFWFTLMHEVVHVSRHLSPDRRIIFDDLSQEAHDDIEREADAQAAEILIPESQWQSSAVRHTHGKADAEEFARSLQRHPAIVVGRLQHETSNFRMLAKSPGVGRGQTRCCFSEFANGGSAYEKNREGCEDF